MVVGCRPQEMLARLVVCFGGRAAEELIFGHDAVTSGASSDVAQATRLATAMVTQFAMSDKVRGTGVVHVGIGGDGLGVDGV